MRPPYVDSVQMCDSAVSLRDVDVLELLRVVSRRVSIFFQTLGRAILMTLLTQFILSSASINFPRKVWPEVISTVT